MLFEIYVKNNSAIFFFFLHILYFEKDNEKLKTDKILK